MSQSQGGTHTLTHTDIECSRVVLYSSNPHLISVEVESESSRPCRHDVQWWAGFKEAQGQMCVSWPAAQ